MGGGNTLIKAKCCREGSRATQCRPTYKCVERVINTGTFKSAIGCDRGFLFFAKEATCKAYLSHANSFIKDAEKVADDYLKRSKAEGKNAQQTKKGIERFVQLASTDDVFNTAALAGRGPTKSSWADKL